jgi:hypothetical protein
MSELLLGYMIYLIPTFNFRGPYKRREKLNIESAADFPTLGAAADTTPEGFEQVSQKSAGKSWGAGSMAVSASTGISNRFQGLENH